MIVPRSPYLNGMNIMTTEKKTKIKTNSLKYLSNFIEYYVFASLLRRNFSFCIHLKELCSCYLIKRIFIHTASLKSEQLKSLKMN